MSKFYFLIDNSVQWFSAIVEMDNEKVCQFHNVPVRIDADIISDICSREIHFANKEIHGMTYSGFSISRREFDKIKEIVELYPKYKRYCELTHD